MAGQLAQNKYWDLLEGIKGSIILGGNKMSKKENEELALSEIEERNLNNTNHLEDITNYELGENPIITLMEKAIAIPGVKVNRTTFLMETYKLSGTVIESEDVFSKISLEQMDKAATSIINKNVTASSSASFFLGLPGGVALVASMPADVMQNFAFSLRLAQQLAYVYGFENLFENEEMSEKTRNTLIAFLGIMFVATGSGTLLRAIAPNVGKHVAKQALSKPLTKTVWYPMLKKVSNIVASKTITKASVSGFATKAIPVVGGVASAGINVATMVPMANRLKNELRKYYLSEEEIRELEASKEAEKKEKVDFSEKASDVASDVAAGAIKMANKTKGIGAGLGKFAKKIGDKTKSKIDEQDE